MSINLMKEHFTPIKARSRGFLPESITDPYYADDLALLANTVAQLHSLEQAARGNGLYEKLDKREFKCFKQDGAISTINGKPLKLVDQ